MAFTKDISVMDIATLAVVGASGLAVFFGEVGDRQVLETRMDTAESNIVEIKAEMANDKQDITHQIDVLKEDIEKSLDDTNDRARRIEDKLDRLIERELER